MLSVEMKKSPSISWPTTSMKQSFPNKEEAGSEEEITTPTEVYLTPMRLQPTIPIHSSTKRWKSMETIGSAIAALLPIPYQTLSILQEAEPTNSRTNIKPVTMATYPIT